MGVWLFPFFSRCLVNASLGQTPRSGIAGSWRLRVLRFGRFRSGPHSQAAEPGCIPGSESASEDSSLSPLCQLFGAFCFDGYAGVCCCLIQAEYLTPPCVFISHLDILCGEVLFKSLVAILKNNYYNSLWHNSDSVGLIGYWSLWYDYFYLQALKIFIYLTASGLGFDTQDLHLCCSLQALSCGMQDLVA